MNRILLRFGILEIHSYGLMVTIAFVVWIFLCMMRAPKRNIKSNHIIHLSLILFLSASIGARLLFIVIHVHSPNQFWHEILTTVSLISIGVKGISMIGGILMSLLAIVLYCYYQKIPLLKLLDVMAPPFGIGLFLARIGCFLNGCCFGKPCDLPWAMKFPVDSQAGMYFPGIAIHPTQLYSALSGLIIALILFLLDRKSRFDGFLFSILGILFGISRLIIDPFKYIPPRSGTEAVIVTQSLSITIIVLTTTLYFALKHKNAK